MLEFDECSQILVPNPFADDSSTVSSSNSHETLVTLALDASSSEHHPLRSRSVSPACRCNTPSIPSVVVVGSEVETRPRLTRLLSSYGSSTKVAAEEDRTADSEVPCDGSDIIIHPVCPFHHVSFISLTLLFNHRSVPMTLLLALPSAMAFPSLPFAAPTNYGRLTQSISVLSF